MSQPYLLTTKHYEDGKFIHFHNTQNAFVEVIFVINDREIRENQLFNTISRGYGFAPKLDKSVRKNKNGSLIPVQKGDVVKAFIFSGVGSYKEEDIEKPAFLRHKLIEKFHFRRLSNEPVEVLEMKVV